MIERDYRTARLRLVTPYDRSKQLKVHAIGATPASRSDAGHTLGELSAISN